MARNQLCREWQAIKRLNDNYKAIANKIGAKLTRSYWDGTIINQPSAMAFDGNGNLVVANYYGQTYRFTNDWQIDLIFPIAYEEPDLSNGIAFSLGFAVNATKIAIASYARHLVRIYDRFSGAILAQIGIYGQAGNAVDGKLFNPHKLVWLDNGNLLVCCHSGTGIGAGNQGHITEYDGSSGALIATRAGYFGNGQSRIGTNIVYKPYDIKLEADYLWVTELLRDRVLKINTATWLIEDIYYGIDYPRAICFLSDGNFAVASGTTNKIYGVEPDHSIIWSIDCSKICVSGGFRDLIEIEPGYLAFTDSEGGTLTVVPIEPELQVDFAPIPALDGYEVASEYLPKEFNLATGKAHYNFHNIDRVASEIVIPYRAICS